MSRLKPLNEGERHQQELYRLYEESVGRSELPGMDVPEYLDVAEYCYLNQSPSKACEVLENALLAFPQDDDILSDLGLYQIECNWIKEARHTYEMISDKKEMNARVLLSTLLLMDKRLEEAMDVLMDEEEEPFEPMEIARLLMRNGYKQEALAVLEKVTPRDEHEKFLHLELMADLKTDLECYDEAVDLYNQLLDMEPYDSSNWYELGCCYYKSDNLPKAIECLDYAIVANPEMSMAYQVRGECYILLGNIEKGCKDLTRCAKRNGLIKDDLLYFIHSELIEKGNETDAQKVLSLLSKQECLDEVTRADLFMTLSFLHASRGELDEGEHCVNMALKLFPDSFNIRLTKGLLRMDRGDYYGGRKHLDKISRECNDPFMLATLAEAMVERNHLTDALSYMDKAVDLESPENLCVNCLTGERPTAMQFLALEYCKAKPDTQKLVDAYHAYHDSEDAREKHNILTKVSRMLMSKSSARKPKDSGAEDDASPEN